MQFALVFIVIFAGFAQCQNDNIVRTPLSDTDIKEMMNMVLPEQIRYFGYPTETHTVVTDDGYILTINRVPNGKAQQFDNRRPIILLQHCLHCYAGDFFLTGPGNSLGYIFADAGFDVWAMNGRGTKYSRKHVSLDPNRHRAFWAYSFHELGVHDLAKVIDYVLGFRKAGQLIHAGFSEGSSAYYALMSVKPEYNEKVSVHYSLAPSAYFRHMRSLPILIGSSMADTIMGLATLFNISEVSSSTPLTHLFFRLCRDSSTRYLCKISVFVTAGFDERHLDDRLFPLIFTNFPVSASYQQLMHYSQLIDTGEFRQFDYGRAKNLQLYNASTPPEYDLSRISSRVRLIYSCTDYISSCDDVDYLYRRLPNAAKLKVQAAYWNHFDYVWGTGIKTYLADLVLEDLKKFI